MCERRGVDECLCWLWRGPKQYLTSIINSTDYWKHPQVLYQLSAVDSNGVVRHFEKPLFLTLLMFLAMACALPIYSIMQVSQSVCASIRFLMGNPRAVLK